MKLCIDCKHCRPVPVATRSAAEPMYDCHHPDTASPVTGATGWPCYKLRWGDSAHGLMWTCGPDGNGFEPKDTHAAVHAAVRRSG